MVVFGALIQAKILVPSQLEQELLISVPHWEGEVGKPLLVNGIHFMGVLEEAVRADEAKADSKKVSAMTSRMKCGTMTEFPH
jgi:hypothetical protein